jgi:hypothetical protein
MGGDNRQGDNGENGIASRKGKLRILWGREKQEKEQFHKRVMRKALQTVTMEKEVSRSRRWSREERPV